MEQANLHDLHSLWKRGDRGDLVREGRQRSVDRIAAEKFIFFGLRGLVLLWRR